MKINSIDRNVSGNLGLVNQYRIQLCQLSGLIHFIFKNYVKRTSYTSFQPNNQQFMYTDEVTDQSISLRVILLKIYLYLIKPQLVIDHRAKYRELKYLNIEACQNNAYEYLTTIKQKKIEVDSIHKDDTTYNMQRMNTLIFDKLSKTGCEDFLADVEWQNSEWIKDPVIFNTEYSMVDLKNLYINYKTTGLWDAYRKDPKSIIITLTTALKREQSKNSSRKNPKGTTRYKPNDIDKWHFKPTGKDKSDPEGNKFV